MEGQRTGHTVKVDVLDRMIKEPCDGLESLLGIWRGVWMNHIRDIMVKVPLSMNWIEAAILSVMYLMAISAVRDASAGARQHYGQVFLDQNGQRSSAESGNVAEIRRRNG